LTFLEVVMRKLCLIVLAILTFVIGGIALADDVYYKTKVIDAQNTWTDPVTVLEGGGLNASIDPDTSPIMTIYLQCKYPGETSFDHDVEHWDLTAASTDVTVTLNQIEPEKIQYRIGSKTGGYTSGNCTVRIGTGRLP